MTLLTMMKMYLYIKTIPHSYHIIHIHVDCYFYNFLFVLDLV